MLEECKQNLGRTLNKIIININKFFSMLLGPSIMLMELRNLF